MDFRKVERLDGETWAEIPFENLRTGDTFRLFDITSDPIENGTTNYIATSDAFPCEPDGNWGVESHPQVRILQPAILQFVCDEK